MILRSAFRLIANAYYVAFPPRPHRTCTPARITVLPEREHDGTPGLLPPLPDSAYPPHAVPLEPLDSDPEATP